MKFTNPIVRNSIFQDYHYVSQTAGSDNNVKWEDKTMVSSSLCQNLINLILKYCLATSNAASLDHVT